MNRTRSRSRARSNDGLSTPSRILAACSALWAVLMTTMPVAKAQEEVCSCSPSTYEFRFNFDLRCPRPGEDYGPGISEVTCFITSYSADVLDLNPIEVQSISIVESDIERVPIAQSAVDGEFRDGSTFTYSSVSALGDDNARIPQSIQLTITATNTVGEVLVQVWAIKFTNDCGVFPVLEVGESFGWTEFSMLGTPRNEACPAAPGSPTMAPTEDNLIVGPEPTAQPSAAPSKGTKTSSPTSFETEPPTALPSAASSKGTKTSSPTSFETEPPTALPTVASTKSPKGGNGPNEPPTAAPTALPTLEPSQVPVAPPNSTPAPTEADSIIEERPSATSESFSYDFTLDEDYDFEMEWGRGKKGKKTSKDDSRDSRSRVRIGQRRR